MALHIPIFFLSLQPLFSDGYLTHTHIHTHTFAILTDTRISPNEEQTKTRGNVSREVDCNFNAVLNSSRKANGWFGMEYDPSWALFDFNRIISRWMITDQKTWDNNKLGLLARFFFLWFLFNEIYLKDLNCWIWITNWKWIINHNNISCRLIKFVDWYFTIFYHKCFIYGYENEILVCDGDYLY